MLKLSSNSVKVFFLDGEQVRRRLYRAARSLLDEEPTVRKVLLFGSMQRGDYAPGSDADVAIILDFSDTRDWFRRIPRFLPRFSEVGVGVDLFPYTEDEFALGLQQGNPLFQSIAAGEVLAERP